MHNRRTVLASLTAAATSLALGCRGVAEQPPEAVAATDDGPQTAGDRRMPVVFVGHGSPMNAVEDNRWSRGFAALADALPTPAAILAISAHWYTRGTFLTDNAAPTTIHDFSGVPQALFEVQYPAPGSPELARRVRGLLGEARSALSSDWGLDHGTWSVLRRAWPQAKIPVVQLSLDRTLTQRQHLSLGRSLAALREEGVLILGSGNIVHNLGDAIQHKRAGRTAAPAWAAGFDEDIARALVQHDTDALLARGPASADGGRAHPYPDHWLPLLYAAAAADDRDEVRFPIEGFDWGSISMRSVIFG